MPLIDELLGYYNEESMKKFIESFLYSSDNERSNRIQSTLAELYKELHSITKYQFHPDFNSHFNLVILLPPHLSAPEYEEIFGKPFEINPNENQKFFYKTIKSIPILVSNISLPTRSVRITENKLITGSLPVPEEVTTDNQITVTYYETFNQNIYTFHKIWIEYIDEVSKGIVKPDDYYIENGYIDFASSMFVLKFDVLGQLKKLIYATQLIPISINPNEILNIESSDIYQVTITYQIYTYEEFDYYELEQRGVTINNPQNHPFLLKLRQVLSYWVKESNDYEYSTFSINTNEVNKYAEYISDSINTLQKRTLLANADFAMVNTTAEDTQSINNRISSINNIRQPVDLQGLNNNIDQQLTNAIQKTTELSNLSVNISSNQVTVTPNSQSTYLASTVFINNVLNLANSNFDNLDNETKISGAKTSYNVLKNNNVIFNQILNNTNNCTNCYVDLQNSNLLYQKNGLTSINLAANFLTKFNNESSFTNQDNINQIQTIINNGLNNKQLTTDQIQQLSNLINQINNDLDNYINDQTSIG